MSNDLGGRRIAFLATDGVEQVELTQPWQAVRDAGGSPVLVSTKPGTIQGFNHHDKGDVFDVDVTVDEASADHFDGLVLPGGVINPDRLRMHETAMRFVQGFVEAGKPIAAICHGPWSLIEVGGVEGRVLTSWPSLRTDIENAGGTWVDEQVHVDDRLVTSRKPDDLPAFCRTLVEVMATAPRQGQPVG